MTRPISDTAELRDARKFTKQVYGSALEQKASDSFCAAVYQRQADRAPGRGRRAAFEALPARDPLPTIVEFAPSDAVKSKPKDKRSNPKAAAVAVAVADRVAALHQLRTANYQALSTVYNEIERLTTTPVGLAPELGLRQIPTLITQVCWLNRTVRTWAGPAALTDVTADPSVTAVDVPRRLQAEASPINHVTVGLPRFVERTKFTGSGITVAVIDSEVALRHPALAGRVVQRRNYTAESWGNADRHGTAVAGLIGADDKNAGGIAPGATIYNYKVLATSLLLNGDDFSGALAIQQALEDGAAVANCSWGVGPVASAKSREAIAVDTAWALGMVVVKSAGNSGPDPKTVTTPADADGVIVVGATNLEGTEIPEYSSRGPAGRRRRPHIVAPGGDDKTGNLLCCVPTGGFGDAGQGTSYAAPQVSGAVALLLQESPELSPDQVRDKLTSSASELARVPVNAQGHGLMQLS